MAPADGDSEKLDTVDFLYRATCRLRSEKSLIKVVPQKAVVVDDFECRLEVTLRAQIL